MGPLQVVLGTISVLFLIVASVAAYRAVRAMIRIIRTGQPDGTRSGPVKSRAKTLLVESLGHTRMLKWSTIGIARAYPQARVDGYDIDEPSVEQARRNAEESGVADRIRFTTVDAAAAEEQGSYDLVTAFECVHDLADPVGVLGAMRRMGRPGGTVLGVDEKVAERFTAPGDVIERLIYGYSVTCCLPDGLSVRPSAGTGAVMRPATLERYAREAGFAGVDILPVEHDFFRFYRLHNGA